MCNHFTHPGLQGGLLCRTLWRKKITSNLNCDGNILVKWAPVQKHKVCLEASLPHESCPHSEVAHESWQTHAEMHTISGPIMAETHPQGASKGGGGLKVPQLPSLMMLFHQGISIWNHYQYFCMFKKNELKIIAKYPRNHWKKYYLYLLHHQHCVCWCPGTLWRQDISKHSNKEVAAWMNNTRYRRSKKKFFLIITKILLNYLGMIYKNTQKISGAYDKYFFRYCSLNIHPQGRIPPNCQNHPSKGFWQSIIP